MKSKKEKIETHKQENIPIITSQMMEKTAIEIAQRKAGKKRSPIVGVKHIDCPSCGRASMSFLDDLVFEVTLAGERMVIPNLTGLKCTKCNISTVGGGKIGIYFPRDIIRVMKIKKNEKAVLTPLSSHKMIVELFELNA